MILGNKCDLSESRVVSKERGQLLADEHSIKFMETSAKASINVEEVLCVVPFALVCVWADTKKNSESFANSLYY